MTASEHDDAILTLLMCEEVLTDEQYGRGDHLILLDSRDTWRSHREGFKWFESSQRWFWGDWEAYSSVGHIG